jgi:hypothetical protein
MRVLAIEIELPPPKWAPAPLAFMSIVEPLPSPTKYGSLLVRLASLSLMAPPRTRTATGASLLRMPPVKMPPPSA